MALEIVQILASGTFGHVSVVRDTATGQLWAAKVLKEQYRANPKVVGRLKDEAALLQRLQHPHVVGVSELRPVQGCPVLLLEWVRGAPLNALLARCPQGLAPPEVCEIVRTTAATLRELWRRLDPSTGEPMAVIHRDLKPSNLLLDIHGTLKLVDFGIARGEFEGKESQTVSVVLGAHGYLAPERLDGATDTPAGDIYALGCVFFELLTGRKVTLSMHPRKHAERMAQQLMHLRPEHTSPRLIHELSNLIARMAAYEPAQRPDHQQVVDGVMHLMSSAGWVPDLPALGATHVTAHLREAPRLGLDREAARRDLAFLETPTGHTPDTAPPRTSDHALRSFLADAQWHHKPQVLDRLLAADPCWTADPLLEALDRAVRSRTLWRRWWGTFDEASREKVVTLLELLRSRPTDAVLRRVRRLERNRDPEVRELARQFR
ncbi:MAG: serine/threonine protein kinase [Myxococcales bacterium]|nr:serine/threonine protein kinase [Myxococcales bacterium]